MGAEDEFAQAIEIISGLYYFIAVKRADSPRFSSIAQTNVCYCIDDELLYEPFFADFGPLNLGRTHRFCQKTKQLLQEAERNGKRLYLYSGPHAHQKANAAVLVGIYQVLYLNRTTDAAYKPLSAYKPYVPFRDASCGVSTFHLAVYDVMRGIQRARDVGFIDWNSGSSTWSLEEYEYYEQVDNGDLNWILPGKFVAFSGPAARSNEIAGYRLHTPEDYWDYFRRRGVTTVIRLNKKVYDRKRFLDGGFKHHELYFPDGSCPNDAIIQRFLDTVEAEPGAIAVHCKAGLGRTGLLICLYIMKHYRFTAEEVIGYIRVCRPGSVIGPQQNFLREMEARMWHEGELYRAARGLPKAVPAVSDLMVAGRAAGYSDLAASPTPVSLADGGGMGSMNGRNSSSSNNYSAAVSSPYGQMRSSTNGTVNRSMPSNNGSATNFLVSGAGVSSPPAGDMSLLQYSKMQHYGSSSAGSGVSASYDHGTAGSIQPTLGATTAAGSSGYGSSSYTPGSYGAVSSFRSRYNGVGSGYNTSVAAGVGRSMTPLRYSQQSTVGYHIGTHHHHHQVSAGGHYGATGAHHPSASHPGPLQASGAAARGSLGISSVSRSINVPNANGTPTGVGRSPSTGRMSVAAGLAAPPTSSAAAAAGLRSTLHTDTLAAAERPKLIPERNTQSADIGAGFGLGATSYSPSGVSSSQQSSISSAPWRIVVPPASMGSLGAGTLTGAGGGSAGSGINRTPSLNARGGMGSGASPGVPGSTSGGVARILAPNGQPRKVPVALLNQYVSQQGVGSGVGSWAAAGSGPGTPLGAGIGGPKPPAGSAPTQIRSSFSYGLRQ